MEFLSKNVAFMVNVKVGFMSGCFFPVRSCSSQSLAVSRSLWEKKKGESERGVGRMLRGSIN